MAGLTQPVECPKCKHSNLSGSVLCANCSIPLSSENLTLTEAMGDGWSVVTPPSGENALPGLTAGRVIASRYEILQLLGEGGMGAVFKAMDRQLDRVVAVKVIRPELAGHPTILRRFKQELLLARQVTHRNVIRIFDLGVADGLHFITMDFVQGRDLNSVLEERKFTAAESVKIIRQVAEALDAAHTESVIHRDLKPHNIMLSDAGKVYVMDFGLARSVEATGITRTGALLGTPTYMSPEQAKGTTVDTRSDLFSLGVIFYEMLTGEVPFKADTVLGMLLKRTQEPPRPPMEVDPTIPAVLSDVVMKCLAIDPAKRYQAATELGQDLRNFEEQASGVSVKSRTIIKSRSLAGPSGIVTPRFRVMAESGAWKWIAASLALMMILLGGAAVWLKLLRSTQSPVQHPIVTVLVADLENHTGDPIFDGTLEPMLNVALEGASFVNGYSRGDARKLARQLPHPTDKLDEQSSRLIAVSQGLGAIVAGALSRRGEDYRLSVEAIDAVNGSTIGSAEVNASSKDGVLLAIPKLMAPIRKALGDTTPESVQLTSASGAFTAASLEVVRQYSIAMEQQFAGKMEDALRSFSKAAELDPSFARAYSGMAATSGNLGRLQDAEKYVKLAMEHVDRMTERERLRTRGLYYRRSENWQKCIEEYSDLVKQYPADNLGHLNLGVCYAASGNMSKAAEETRKAVEISPKAAMQRMNLSLLSSYAGDFKTGEKEARAVQQMNPSYEKGYLALAYAELGQSRLAQAAETYQQLGRISPLGASISASGLADIATYEGRFSEAVRILEKGATADGASKNPDGAVEKFAALAYAQLLRGEKRLSIDAVKRALAITKKVDIRFLLARVLVEAGEVAQARELAAGLASELASEPHAYAKLIEGEIALKSGNPQVAIKAFTEAVSLTDTWLGRFDLGRAYLEVQAFTEADSEFDRCIKRRGETLDLYGEPSYGYFPPVYYYQGRVREGLKSPGAADSYRTYLSIRGKAGEDPLLSEIRHRAGQ